MTHLDMSEVLDFVGFIWKTICICICICMIIELLMGFMTMWLKEKSPSGLSLFWSHIYYGKKAVVFHGLTGGIFALRIR
jgi:hypothetical protein